MKEILIGNKSFENIIKGDYIYVDKTKYIYDIIRKSGEYYFLSRPRRFGKSLTISTLEAIFKGKRELFKGLYIDSTDYDWKEYPVIHIDFGPITFISIESLMNQIKNIVLETASDYGVEIPRDYEYNEALRLLIKKLAEKMGKVVILIDEYDKILSSNIYNPEIEAIRDVLKGFFEVIKASGDYLRFVFITGVTKYAKVSIFSSMNNLVDYTMSGKLATAFGYTQEEVETYFADYIKKGMEARGEDRETYLEKLKDMYDGYCFAPGAETLYNPVSIGTFFSEGGIDFERYWIDTGGTKLLTDIAKKVNYNIDSSLDEPLGREDITNFDIVDMAKKYVTLPQYKSLLFQSGYLTIKRTEDEGHTLFLDYPNGEVKSAFASIILNSYLGDESINLNPTRLRNAFEERETEKAVTILKSYYANMSGLLTSKSVEADYQLMLHCMLIAVDADINVEVVTNKGRIDGVLKTKDTIYVIELKRDESADAAIKQIKDKDYVERYLAWRLDSPNHQIRLLGMNFSSKERNITEWKEEILD